MAGSKVSLVISVEPLASICSPLGAWPFWSSWFLSCALKCRHRGRQGVSQFLQLDREAEEAWMSVLPSSTALGGVACPSSRWGEGRECSLCFPTPKPLDVEVKGTGVVGHPGAAPGFFRIRVCPSAAVAEMQTVSRKVALHVCVALSECPVFQRACQWMLPAVSEGHPQLRLCALR